MMNRIRINENTPQEAFKDGDYAILVTPYPTEDKFKQLYMFKTEGVIYILSNYAGLDGFSMGLRNYKLEKQSFMPTFSYSWRNEFEREKTVGRFLSFIERQTNRDWICV